MMWSNSRRTFLGRFNSETGRRIRGFAKAAVRRLREYHWPGNVRELKNVVERAVVMCGHDVIDADDLLPSQLDPRLSEAPVESEPETVVERSLADVEKVHIAATLRLTGWNKTRAAGILGIERSTLDRKIRRHGIERPKK